MAIRKRGGVWYVDFRYQDPLTGKTKRFKRSAGRHATKKEAQALERQWRREIISASLDRPRQDEQPEAPRRRRRRDETPERPMAFDAFAWHFYALHTVPNCKPSTHRAVEGILRVHLIPFFGSRSIDTITVEDIARFKAAKARQASPKSVNNWIGVLSRLFRSATEWGYIERNPVTGIGLLRVPPQEFRFWDAEESRRFLDAVLENDPDWWAFFLCALRTGMRIGELTALRWSDVDLDGSVLHVRRSVHRRVVTSPKNGRGRTIPLSPELRDALAAHRGTAGPQDLVFPGRRGSWLNRDKTKHRLWRNAKAAGLPRIRIHDLRHSFASQLVMAGVPLIAVQQYLGHSDLTMTMRYSHLSPRARQDYIACLDRPGEDGD